MVAGTPSLVRSVYDVRTILLLVDVMEFYEDPISRGM